MARDANGIPSIRRVTTDIVLSNVTASIKSVRANGANEVHIHRLADGTSERAAIVADRAVLVSSEAA